MTIAKSKVEERARSTNWRVLTALYLCGSMFAGGCGGDAPSVDASGGNAGASTGGGAGNDGSGAMAGASAGGDGGSHSGGGQVNTGGTGGGQNSGGGTGGAPASCGNSTVEAGEDCDDGDESVTCNENCTSSTCGDEITNETAGEDCDDGDESVTCNENCTSSTCGDEITNETAGEDCDDANSEDRDDCVACSSAFCGDGIRNQGFQNPEEQWVFPNEACDTGGDSVNCDEDCTIRECGDNHWNTVAEECDDGNEDNGDGCSENCEVEL